MLRCINRMLHRTAQLARSQISSTKADCDEYRFTRCSFYESLAIVSKPTGVTVLKFLSAIATACAVLVAQDAAAATISNNPANNTVCCFGTSASLAYGQVFEAPVTGRLTSFTMYLNGGVGDIVGAIGTWNGASSYGAGFGSPSTLYTSDVINSDSGGSFTFLPAISVTAGNLYVAFLTTFGQTAIGATDMPLGDDLPGASYFVWNNTSTPFDNPSWNYFFNTGDVQFSATFVAAVPLPAGLPLLLIALGGLGLAARRRKAF